MDRKKEAEGRFEITISLNYKDTLKERRLGFQGPLTVFEPSTDFIQIYAEYSIVYFILLESLYSHY